MLFGKYYLNAIKNICKNSQCSDCRLYDKESDMCVILEVSPADWDVDEIVVRCGEKTDAEHRPTEAVE